MARCSAATGVQESEQVCVNTIMFSEGSLEIGLIPHESERRHYNSLGSSKYPNLDGNGIDHKMKLVG